MICRLKGVYTKSKCHNNISSCGIAPLLNSSLLTLTHQNPILLTCSFSKNSVWQYLQFPNKYFWKTRSQFSLPFFSWDTEYVWWTFTVNIRLPEPRSIWVIPTYLERILYQATRKKILCSFRAWEGEYMIIPWQTLILLKMIHSRSLAVCEVINP